MAPSPVSAPGPRPPGGWARPYASARAGGSQRGRADGTVEVG